MNVIELSLFSNRISAICVEMGAILQRAAFSPNIKDRLDFSCAIFDAQGGLCAQAAHIPVHLGSMAFAMQDIIDQLNWQSGDMLILNDPYLGGTHLPDVTIITPVFISQELFGFVVNRAHHADIGAASPGSMPISTSLEMEGVIIAPILIMKNHKLDVETYESLIAKMSHQMQSEGDFSAQISANQLGLQRLSALIEEVGFDQYQAALNALNAYGERLAKASLAEIPDGEYCFSDLMDDDGQGLQDIAIKVKINISASKVDVDFRGTAGQVVGNINCPLSVAAAAVYYVFRCLMPAQTPACAGTFKLISLSAPKGSLLNAVRPAAVAAGNVETSTRVVDVIMGALAKAIPEKMAAASHGSMNNVAMGMRINEFVASVNSAKDKNKKKSGKESAAGKNTLKPSWNYYETIGGGMGAHVNGDGLSALQTHMTNTLNTPIESLEIHYPLRISEYSIRENSGGKGRHQGGNGLIREFEFLAPAQVTLLTERRRYAPWGLSGGASGEKGINTYDGNQVSSKIELQVEKGKKLKIETPGGGGYGV